MGLNLAVSILPIYMRLHEVTAISELLSFCYEIQSNHFLLNQNYFASTVLIKISEKMNQTNTLNLFHLVIAHWNPVE